MNRILQFVLLFLLLSVAASAQTTANLWVDTNGGTCTRNSSPAAYVDAAACASLSAAYNASSAGDTIRIRTGSYGAQSTSFRSLGSPSNLTHVIADGGIVNISGGLSIDSQNIDVDGVVPLTGFTLTGAFVIGSNTASDGSSGCSKSFPGGGWPCLFRNTNVQLHQITAGLGGFIYGDTVGIHGFVIPSHEVCPSGEDGIQVLGLGNGGTSSFTPSVNVVIDGEGGSIGPLTHAGCGAHNDQIQGFGYRNLTIRRIHFLGGGTDILAYAQDNANPSQVDTILIEDNSFASTDQNHGISLGNDASHLCGTSNLNNVVQNNTWYAGFDSADVNCSGTPDGILRNNIDMSSGEICGQANHAEWQYDHNVYGSAQTGSGCKTTTGAKACNPNFVDGSHAGGNIDLNTSDTCAKDSASSSFSTVDIHGTTRPQGATADIGAMEVVGSAPTFTANPSTTVSESDSVVRADTFGRLPTFSITESDSAAESRFRALGVVTTVSESDSITQSKTSFVQSFPTTTVSESDSVVVFSAHAIAPAITLTVADAVTGGMAAQRLATTAVSESDLANVGGAHLAAQTVTCLTHFCGHN